MYMCVYKVREKGGVEEKKEGRQRGRRQRKEGVLVQVTLSPTGIRICLPVSAGLLGGPTRNVFL